MLIFINSLYNFIPIKFARWLNWIFLFTIGLIISYLLSANAGINFPVRLGLGIAFLAYVFSPYKHWPIIAAVQLLISFTFLSIYPFKISLIIASAETIATVLAAFFLRITNRITILSRHTRGIVDFTVAVSCANLIGSISLFYCLKFFAPEFYVSTIWITWTLSGILGIVIVTPSFLWWRNSKFPEIYKKFEKSWIEMSLLFITSLVVTYVIYNLRFRFTSFNIDFQYLILPFVLWASIRFHPRFLSILLILIACIILLYLKFSIQQTSTVENFYSITSIQIFLLFIVLLSYMMAIITMRRNEADAKILKLNEKLEKRVTSRTRELADTMEALRTSEEQFREAFENSIQGMALISVDGHFLRVNSAFCDMIGYQVSSLLKLNLRKISHRDDFLQEMRMQKKLFKGEIEYYQIEKRLIHKQKLDVWVLQSNSIIRDSDGTPILMVSQIVNITDRKQAENQLQKTSETLTVLLREVNHRVKNNLSALIGILHMEEDRADTLDRSNYIQLLRDLGSRIHGLSMVHSMLSAQNWQPLNISILCEQIVYALLKSMAKDLPIKMTVNATDIRVNSNQAHHLTLVINELATNSLKYGVLNNTEAHINIHVSEFEDKIQIIYRDSGPGYPDEILSGNYETSGIGFELIQGIVSQSLDGEVIFRNDNGAVTEIQFSNELT